MKKRERKKVSSLSLFKKKKKGKKEKVYCKTQCFRVFPESTRYVTNNSVNPVLNALKPASGSSAPAHTHSLAPLLVPRQTGTETYCEVSNKHI